MIGRGSKLRGSENSQNLLPDLRGGDGETWVPIGKLHVPDDGQGHQTVAPFLKSFWDFDLSLLLGFSRKVQVFSWVTLVSLKKFSGLGFFPKYLGFSLPPQIHSCGWANCGRPDLIGPTIVCRWQHTQQSAPPPLD